MLQNIKIGNYLSDSYEARYETKNMERFIRLFFSFFPFFSVCNYIEKIEYGSGKLHNGMHLVTNIAVLADGYPCRFLKSLLG